MSRLRRNHTRDFKLQCCRQVATAQKRPAQICREHNLSESVLLRWRKEYEARGEAAFTEGTLQAEVRRYYRKDGSVKEQGPYWYFRYHEGGKQKKLYLGRTDDPEGELARKRELDGG